MDGKLWPITFRAESAKEYLDAQAAALDFVLNADRTILADEIEEACKFIESMREVDTDLLSRSDRDRLWDISRQYGEIKSMAEETDIAQWNFWCEAMQEQFAANDLAMIRDALPQLESFQVSMNSLPADLRAMCHDIFVRAQIMLTLCQPAKDYGWYAPTQGTLQHLVNEQEVLQLYLMRDQVAASALVTDLHSVLLQAQEVFGQTENEESFGRTLSIFKKMTATDSYSSLKFTINMIGPLFYHGVRINQMSVLAEVLDQLQPKIKGMASRIAGLDEAFCQRLATGLKGIGIELSPMLFGTAAQFYSDTSEEVERSSHKDLFALIAERCGTDVQAIADYLEKGRLHRLAAEIAEIAVQRLDTEDVRKYYAGIGFLIQGKLQAPYFIRRYERGVLSTAPDEPASIRSGVLADSESSVQSDSIDEDRVIRPETMSGPVTGITMSRAWQDHHEHSYNELKKSKRWKEMNDEIGVAAKVKCDQMLQGSYLKLAKILADEWTKRFEKVLVARRILITMERHLSDLVPRLKRLGWLDEPNPKIEDELKRKRDYDARLKKAQANYKVYCHTLGFLQTKLGDVLSKSYLWPEERAWLDEYQPPR